MKNRSAPPCEVIPVVAYPDIAVAVALLEAAFGFRVRLKIGDHRTQMWFGSACLVVGETGENDQWATKNSVTLRVSDVDAVCARAKQQGAHVVFAPKKHVYGEYQATLRLREAQKSLRDLRIPTVKVRPGNHAAIVDAGGRSLLASRRIK